MLLKKEIATKFENSKTCSVFSYEDYQKEDLSLATAIINGRYPEKDRVLNSESKEIYYVISGDGIIYSEKGEFKIKKGDFYVFEKSEKYYVKGNDLHLSILNIPKFTVEQHHNVK